MIIWLMNLGQSDSFLMMFQFPGARNQFGEYNEINKDMNHGQKYKIKISAV